MANFFMKPFMRYILLILIILSFILYMYKDIAINIGIKIIRHEHTTDWLSAIGTIIGGIFVPFFLWKRNQEENEKNNEILSIDRKSKLYSYLIIQNNSNIELIYNENGISLVNTFLQRYNVLQLYTKNGLKLTNKLIEIHLKFNNTTNINPSEILINKLSLTIYQDGYVQMYEFSNTYKTFKPILVNSDGFDVFIYCCILEEMIDTNKKDIRNIILNFNASIKSIFNIITSCNYSIKMNNFNYRTNQYNDTIINSLVDDSEYNIIEKVEIIE